MAALFSCPDHTACTDLGNISGEGGGCQTLTRGGGGSKYKNPNNL